MKSFIQIPSRYDVRIVENQIVVICTSHTKIEALILASPLLGVDAIMGAVEEHERLRH